MMTVSTTEYVLYRLHAMTIIKHLLFFSLFFPKELLVRWTRNVYEFTESEIATVELEAVNHGEYYVPIQGFPQQITNEHPNYFPTLVVPGPAFPGKGHCAQTMHVEFNDLIQLTLVSAVLCINCNHTNWFFRISL